MRILYYDIDTLRADHLSCYGYLRQTSPHIDRVAREGIRFDNCFVSDAPCLPSRAALFTGRFGFHTGIVGHGGTAADMKLEGPTRSFYTLPERTGWIMALREAGFHTASFSPFAERHSAWWFYEGFNEMYNPGKRGGERADEVVPQALAWLKEHSTEDNWFLHINVWDPHTPYRTPPEYGNPFADAPLPEWPTEEVIQKHYQSYGPHSAHEVNGISNERPSWLPSHLPTEIRNREDYRRWLDGYDTGIHYADAYFGQVLAALEEAGILDDTLIIISSDHGENQGELNVYGDHQTADLITSRVPLIVKFPGKWEENRGRVDKALHYQFDVMATLTEWVGGKTRLLWDARPFTEALAAGREEGRDYLVVSQQAWSCQRSVVFDRYIFIRTYHDGLKDFPEYMLFDRFADPHETENLAAQRPDLVEKGLSLLMQWQDEMLLTSDNGLDPMQTVLRENGPFQVWGALEPYCAYLERTGRAHHAQALRARHGQGK